MLTLKWLGVGVMLGVTAYSALRTTRAERARLALLDAWIALLYYVRGQIDCFSLPMDEILCRADKSLLAELGHTGGQARLSVLLERTALRLDKDTRRTLEVFLRELGSTYREEQVRRCDHYLGQLQAGRERLAAQLPARIKLCVTLHFCLALGAAVLLW